MGEILDRAVTVFVRNAWLFMAIAALLYVPLSITQLSVGDFWDWYTKTLAQTISGGAPPTVPHELMNRLGGFETIQIALLLILSPLVNAAGLYAAGRLLAGDSASFGPALRFAVRRWPRVFGLLLMWAFAGVGIFFGFVLGMTFMAVLLAQLHAAVVAVIFGLGAFGVMLLVMLACFVSFAIGMASLVAEDEGPIGAFRLGVERVLNRDFFWRSVLLGIILVAIAFGFSMVSGIVGFSLLSVTKSAWPMIAISGVAGLVQFGFFSTVLMTYYYDLRARREGADLALLAATLDTAAPQTL